MLIDQMAINAEFKLFYEKLYTSEASDPTEVDDFSAGLTLPILGDSDRNAMERISLFLKLILLSKKLNPVKHQVQMYLLPN